MKSREDGKSEDGSDQERKYQLELSPHHNNKNIPTHLRRQLIYVVPSTRQTYALCANLCGSTTILCYISLRDLLPQLCPHFSLYA